MKVNILLSTYNGEAYLKEQVASIQAQTFTDWQLLIRDDGSTDATKAMIEQLASRDKRIVWINPNDTQNIGVTKSFHRLLTYQTADVYFFSDQDDVWLEDKLSLCLEAIKTKDKNLPLLVYTDLSVVDKNLNKQQASMIRSQSHHANTQLIQELTENTVTGGTMMINHALAVNWQATDTIIMHDWYLALLAAALGQVIYIDQVTQLYRQHDNNVLGARTWSKRFNQWLQPRSLVRRYWQLIVASQVQASHLLELNLDRQKRQLVEDYVFLLDKAFVNRYSLLRKHHFGKNRWFHTLIFKTLILTKWGYSIEDRRKNELLR